MEWAREIRRFRQLNGLKQFALAELLNVDQATVSRWERGVQVPDIASQIQLRTLLQQGMPLHDRLIRHLVRDAPGLAALLDREIRFLELSEDAVALLGLPARRLTPPPARVFFSDPLAAAWEEAVSVGLFDGSLASIRLTAPLRDLRGEDHLLAMLWQPVRLFDGTVLVRIDGRLLHDSLTVAVAPPEIGRLRITRMVDLSKRDGAVPPHR